MTKAWAVLDLCCGMGGLSYAAQNAELTPVAGVDLDAAAMESYKANFPQAVNICEDVSSPNVWNQCKEIIENKPFIIVSGPPCQGFSIAGPRDINDSRNKVLMSVAAAITELSPKAAVVENVAALNQGQNVKLVNKFRRVLNQNGYFVSLIQLNALDFGVPQRRNRVFFLVLPQKCNRKKFLETLSGYYKKPATIKSTLSDLPAPPEWSKKRMVEAIIPNHIAMQHSDKVKMKIATIPPGKGPLSYRKLDPDNYAATLLSGHRAAPAHYSENRTITVREALRLQGFPDSFVVGGPFSRQMTQVTNAVPLPMGVAVLKTLKTIWGDS